MKRRIDEIYTAWSFYGSRRIHEQMAREGRLVNRPMSAGDCHLLVGFSIFLQKVAKLSATNRTLDSEPFPIHNGIWSHYGE